MKAVSFLTLLISLITSAISVQNLSLADNLVSSVESADINKDGKVDEIDLFVVLASFRGPFIAPGSDVNDDGKTDEADCLMVNSRINQDDFNIWIVLKMLWIYLETGRYPGDFYKDGRVNLKDLLLVAIETDKSNPLSDNPHKGEVEAYYQVIYYVEAPLAAPAQSRILRPAGKILTAWAKIRVR